MGEAKALSAEEVIEQIIRDNYDVLEPGAEPNDDALADAYYDKVLTPDAVRSLMRAAFEAGLSA